MFIRKKDSNELLNLDMIARIRISDLSHSGAFECFQIYFYSLASDNVEYVSWVYNNKEDRDIDFKRILDKVNQRVEVF
jgi:hypothetical protein